jgi:hypothetical protein
MVKGSRRSGTISFENSISRQVGAESVLSLDVDHDRFPVHSR